MTNIEYDTNIDWRQIMKYRFVSQNDFSFKLIYESQDSNNLRLHQTIDSWYLVEIINNQYHLLLITDKTIQKYQFNLSEYPYLLFNHIIIGSKFINLQTDQVAILLDKNYKYESDYCDNLYYNTTGLQFIKSPYLFPNSSPYNINIWFSDFFLTKHYLIVIQYYNLIVLEIAHLPAQKIVFEHEDFYPRKSVRCQDRYICISDTDQVEVYSIENKEMLYKMNWTNVQQAILLRTGQMLYMSLTLDKQLYINEPMFNRWLPLNLEIPKSEYISYFQAHNYTNKLLVKTYPKSMNYTYKLYIVEYNP